MVALLGTLADGMGDDFGLVAGDAASGELLGDGERIEHRVSLTRAGWALNRGAAAHAAERATRR